MIENAVISILLYDANSSFYIPQLNLDDFTDEYAREIFGVIKKLYENGEKIDLVTVLSKLSFSKERSKLYDYNAGIVVSNMADYVRQLKTETAKRKLKHLLRNGELRLAYGDETLEVVKDIGKSLNEIDAISSSKLIDVGTIDADWGNREFVSSGFSNIDKMIGGFHFGELTVWSGRSGQGKSTFLSQVMLESVNKGYKVCAYSGELINAQFQNGLVLQACGTEHLEKRYDMNKQCDVYVPNKEAKNKILSWLKGKFYLYNNEFTGNDNNIIEVFKLANKKYGCRVFLVDNLMTAKYDYGGKESYYVQQSQFVGELVRFAKTYNVHVHLIAHPKKTQGELTKEDIAGSLDITNRADNAFTVNRCEDGTTEVKILKNRSDGIQNQFCRFIFDANTKRFRQANNDMSKYKKYGWEYE